MCGKLYDPAAVIKRHACGAEFTRAEWHALPLVGHMADRYETIELRNCTCQSTLAMVVVPRAEASL